MVETLRVQGPSKQEQPAELAAEPRMPLAGGVAISLLAHAAVLAMLVLDLFADTSAGGGGRVLEAVSIELVDGTALEAMRQTAAPAAAAAEATVAESEGTPADADPRVAAEAAPEPARPSERQPDRPDNEEPKVVREEPRAEPPPMLLAALALPDTPPPIPQEPTDTRAEPEPRKLEPAPASAAAAGGAAARASEAQRDARADAGASPGEVNRYNGQVSRTISTVMRKLATSGRRGAVVLVFTIGEDGDVTDVRLREPSGDRVLDSLVIRLVRAASFPEPPARLSEDQRTFAVPIRVR